MSLLTIETAADMLAVHPRTIRRYISSGDLPAYRIGARQIRVRASDVDALLVPIPTAGGRL